MKSSVALAALAVIPVVYSRFLLPHISPRFLRGDMGNFNRFPRATLRCWRTLKSVQIEIRKFPTSPRKKRGEIWGTRLSGRRKLLAQ